MAYANMNYSGTYSLDGKENETLPLEKHYLGNWVIYHGSRDYVDGSVTLPELSEGSHSITVYLECDWEIGNETNIWTDKYFDSQTVYFAIILLDKTPPIISNLSIRNETYNQTGLSLNFTINEPTLWISYCLDGKTNITITGNTTMPQLSDGSHDIIIYANDTTGNVGASEIVTFSIEPIETSEPYPTTMVAVASGVSIIAIGVGLLVYFKKRKQVNPREENSAATEIG
jgi:hypothetical protein